MFVDQWSIKAGAEPLVRVGIILPTDCREEVSLSIPKNRCMLTADGRPCSFPPEAGESFQLTFALSGDGGEGPIVAVLDGAEVGRAAEWILRAPFDATDADPLLLIHGVPAGRGFHWQQITDQRHAGELVVRAVDGRLLLACHLPLDIYLTGVITSEMSGECPLAFMKSQTVTARSWTLAASERKHAAWDIDLCNDDCCQRFQGLGEVTPSALTAVRETRGEALLAGDASVVDANYSKNCGGIVEMPGHVWGRSKAGLSALVDAPPDSLLNGLMPVTEARFDTYLQASDAYCSPRSVPEKCVARYLGRVDRGGGLHRWTVSYSRQQLEAMLEAEGYRPSGATALDELRVTERGVSGRAVAVEFVWQTDQGSETIVLRDQYEIRRSLHRDFLFSSAFRVRTYRDPDGLATTFHLDGAGWGHGAGLCQIGALGMALRGFDYRAMLAHYFPEATLRALYP